MKLGKQRGVVQRRLASLLITMGLVLVGIVGVAGPASADTGGYPYASYNGPGTNPSGSFWADDSGNGVSPYGYYYRNCTDYVAWKLESLGVPDAEVRGLGNGGEWATKADGRSGVSVSATPTVGSAAVEVGTSSNPYGHVAFVEAVNANGTLTVSEYNWYVNGVPDGAFHRRTATPSSMGLSKYVNFGAAGSAPPSSGWNGVGNATYLGSDRLTNGQQMHGNQYIMSSDGRFVLMMQTDGNLVEYTASGAVWYSGTSNNPGAWLGVQSDGNLVIYSAGGVALWNTGPIGITALVVQNDAHVVGYADGAQARWYSNYTTSTGGLNSRGTDTLYMGQTMVREQYLVSADGRYHALMQDDGNLVVYAPGYRVVWNSGTNNNPGAYLALQGDGNMVIYSSSNVALWNTSPRGIARVAMQSDGNFVTYNGNNVAQWYSNTSGHL